MKTNRSRLAAGALALFLAWTGGWAGADGSRSGASALIGAARDEAEPVVVRVSVRFAKIRSLPDAGGRIVKEIGYGTMLRVVGQSGDYFQVAALDAPAAAAPWYVLRQEVEEAPPAATQALVDTRQVTYAPAEPRAGQPLLFIASNFRTPNVLKWDMGDGTVLTSGGRAVEGQGATLSYAYASPGTYLVKVFDDGGSSSSPPATVRVTVRARARSLRVSPDRPLANHPVVITAFDFNTPEKIAWDLGDGTEIQPGEGPGVVKASFVVSHAYEKEGVYTVKAYDAGGDKTLPPLNTEIRVAADPRRIQVQPERADAGTVLEFSALQFNTPDRLRWDMGDGTVFPAEGKSGAPAGSRLRYRYQKPGSYVVRAYDWDGDSGRRPVQLAVTVGAPAAAAAEHRPQAPAPAALSATARSGYPLIRIGPYTGYFGPQDAWFKKIYGDGDVLYGARLGIHVWQGFYFWLSASRYKVIAKTTYTEEKTTLTLLPVSMFLRYHVGQGHLIPYAGIGYTFLSFKEEAEFADNVKGNGSNISFEAGCEFRLNRHFAIDLGARFDQVKYKPPDINEEIDLGGLQAGVALLVSF